MWTKRSIITPPLHYSIPVSLAASGDLREIIGRPLKLVVVASEFGPDSWRNRISHDDRMFPSPDSIRTSMRPASFKNQSLSCTWGQVQAIESYWQYPCANKFLRT
ncbi:hypothetical protein GW17_00010652 [Ensete ventricosum]|nr:hypothetical protein GW17_00010652 [Ensete ventricosum]RZS06061.1 hypothetical protein BHM03_00036651 [Ensete ventricosum]